MNYKAIFSKLSKDQKNFSLGKSDISQSFNGSLFEETSWFLSNMEFDFENSSDLSKANTKEVDILVGSELSGPSSEKGEVLGSMKNFVEDRVVESKGGTFKFTGGEAKLKATALSGLELDSGEVSLELPSEISKSSKVFFVGAPELDDSLNSVHCVNTKVDLLGNMIHAMKIEDGDFVRVSSEDLEFNLKLINKFKPTVVITLGAMSTNLLLGKKERLSKVHGKIFEQKVQVKNPSGSFTMKVVPIFHPDFLEINPKMKRTAWMDLQEVMKLY